MVDKFKGLENKLEGVHVGDLLYLRTKKGDKAVGFVREYCSQKIVLSHESHTNEASYGDNFPRLTIGDRAYQLASFEGYQVLELPDLSGKKKK